MAKYFKDNNDMKLLPSGKYFGLYINPKSNRDWGKGHFVCKNTKIGSRELYHPIKFETNCKTKKQKYKKLVPKQYLCVITARY